MIDLIKLRVVLVENLTALQEMEGYEEGYLSAAEAALLDELP